MWDRLPDPAYVTYTLAPPALFVVAGILAGVFLYELEAGRVAMRRWPGRLIAILLLVLPAAFTLQLDIFGHGVPPWEASLTAMLSTPGLRMIATALTWAGAFPFLLVGLLALVARPLQKRRWLDAYYALFSALGLAVTIVIFKVAFPRESTGTQPFFHGATAFPHDLPALVVAALVTHAVLRLRSVGSFPNLLPRLPLVLLACWAPVAAGQAHVGDVLASLTLGTAWSIGWFMALQLALIAGQPGSLPYRALDGVERLAQLIFARPRPWLLGLIAFGVTLRILSYWTMHPAVDAFVYASMGQSFLQDGSFTMPWGDAHTFRTEPVPSHHYPPLYPVYLAGFYKVLGFSQATTDVASIVSACAALLVTYFCTRDLYGKEKGLVATALLAISPLLVQNTGQDYSENLVVLLFVATLWAILKSLDKPWYIVPAGLFAGLGYLTKSTMGPFFVVAGLGGLVWRFYWKRWKALQDPAYLVAILLFGGTVAAWMVRNWLLFGSWETSQHVHDAYMAAISQPLMWGFLFLVTLVFYATIGYLVYLAMLPWLSKLAQVPKLASEHDSGLWLALGLPLLLTAVIDACLWLLEGQFFLNNVRYIVFVTIPLVWLILRHASPKDRGVHMATVVSVAVLVFGCLLMAKPMPAYNQDIAADLGERIAPGDSVGFVDGDNHFVYRFYFRLTEDGNRDVPVEIACLEHPSCPDDVQRPGALDTTWIVAPPYAVSALPSGYVEVLDAPWNPDPRLLQGKTLWRITQ